MYTDIFCNLEIDCIIVVYTRNDIKGGALKKKANDVQEKILLIAVKTRAENITSNESRIFSNKSAHSGLTGKNYSWTTEPG